MEVNVLFNITPTM